MKIIICKHIIEVKHNWYTRIFSVMKIYSFTAFNSKYESIVDFEQRYHQADHTLTTAGYLFRAPLFISLPKKVVEWQLSIRYGGRNCL